MLQFIYSYMISQNLFMNHTCALYLVVIYIYCFWHIVSNSVIDVKHTTNVHALNIVKVKLLEERR